MKVTNRVTQVPATLRDAFYDCIEVLQAVDSAAEFAEMRRGMWRLKPLGRRAKNYSGLWSLDLSPTWRLVVRFNRSRTEVTLLSVEDDHQ